MLERGGAENIAHSSSNQMSFKPRAHRNSVFPLSMLNATVWFAKCAFLYHILGWLLGFQCFWHILVWFRCWAMLIIIHFPVYLLDGVWRMAMV